MARKTSLLSLLFYNCMGWTIGVLGFYSRQGMEIFLFTTASRTAVGPTQPRKCMPGAHSLGVKGAGRELTTNVRLVPMSRRRGAIPPLTQHVFMAWCLVKRRDTFFFF